MLIRNRTFTLVAVLLTLTLFYLWAGRSSANPQRRFRVDPALWQSSDDAAYAWRNVTVHFPVETIRPLPNSRPRSFPAVQAIFEQPTEEDFNLREEHRQAVKDVFERCWKSYKMRAWMADELEPVKGGKRNPFGGWAATLVDSLDTLWIMDMRDEFNEAVAAAVDIDFTKTDLTEVNIFETTIRYLGGFLAAFDLSGDARLLRKAVQVGEMIYKAFDTPNRMPITRWNFHAALKGVEQVADPSVLLAEIGSLSMELTHLSQLTGDPKWYDASQRIMDMLAAQQDSTKLPGQWPLVVNAETGVFNKGDRFTLGAMADSTYEYLPKMAALLGGQLPMYQRMYEKAVDSALKFNLFRPMTPTDENILMSGTILTKEAEGKPVYQLDSTGQHLVCFLGGMLALGGRLFSRSQDVSAAIKLTDGCIYTYNAFPHKIMPETFVAVPCDARDPCKWDEKRWEAEVVVQAPKPEEGNNKPPTAKALIASQHLPKGFTRIPDRRYILRPEAIESVFILYRVTAKPELLNTAWEMFTAIDEVTRTEMANSAVLDVTVEEKEEVKKMSSMESFWMGETLKYFYLIFSDPGLISLNEFVFNTEAHPLRRLVA